MEIGKDRGERVHLEQPLVSDIDMIRSKSCSNAESSLQADINKSKVGPRHSVDPKRNFRKGTSLDDVGVTSPEARHPMTFTDVAFSMTASTYLRAQPPLPLPVSNSQSGAPVSERRPIWSRIFQSNDPKLTKQSTHFSKSPSSKKKITTKRSRPSDSLKPRRSTNEAAPDVIFPQPTISPPLSSDPLDDDGFAAQENFSHEISNDIVDLDGSIGFDVNLDVEDNGDIYEEFKDRGHTQESNITNQLTNLDVEDNGDIDEEFKDRGHTQESNITNQLTTSLDPDVEKSPVPFDAYEVSGLESSTNEMSIELLNTDDGLSSVDLDRIIDESTSPNKEHASTNEDTCDMRPVVSQVDETLIEDDSSTVDVQIVPTSVSSEVIECLSRADGETNDIDLDDAVEPETINLNDDGISFIDQRHACTSAFFVGSEQIVEMENSPAEKAGLAILKKRLNDIGRLVALHPHMCIAAESEDAYLVRFLRARKLNIDETITMVLGDHEWRLAEGIASLAATEARYTLGCEVSDIWPYLPCWMQGHDRRGRPVIYKEWGNFWFNEILSHTTTEAFVRYHIWMNEMGSRALGHQSLRLGRRIDKFTCVFNAKGFVPSTMRHGAMAFLKLVIAVDQDHYPERLSTILVINAPRLITVVWSVVKRLLDPVTRDKVHIYASEKKWRPVLESLVDIDEIPDIYGGNAPVKIPDGTPLLCQTSFKPSST